eukprot:4832775-Amphidinium_carterae.1
MDGAGSADTRHRFVQMQRAWLGKRKLQDTDFAEKHRLTRKAAYKWLKGTEHILRLYGREGWGSFLPRPALAAGRWPYIAVSLDQ